ncbi:hypothetical protein BDV98DRAFT_568562 [Pterulicium gracile]|uniref:Transmembrane protein n=1 Tax=Pterulicium gracile TaxID=1884261 RepID=A0A5C3QS14_9AGAR|nr:hypothetical protein BDV98DRAFT_568562 [Pterula gracilis]
MSWEEKCVGGGGFTMDWSALEEVGSRWTGNAIIGFCVYLVYLWLSALVYTSIFIVKVVVVVGL